MANEIPYDSRNIVEKYLNHKLSKNGYVWEFRAHEPDPAPSNGSVGARRGRPARVSCAHEEDKKEVEEEEDEEEEEQAPPPPRALPDPHAALLRVLREAGDELERLYQPDFTEMSKQLRLAGTAGAGTVAGGRRRFTAVVDELFRDGVNWGRIIAFFEFGATVCVDCVDKQMMSQVDNVAGWMTDYLNGPLHAWIQDNGGWDAFVELYGRQRNSVFSSSWPSIATVFSLAALGAVGFTIGAYLAQK